MKIEIESLNERLKSLNHSDIYLNKVAGIIDNMYRGNYLKAYIHLDMLSLDDLEKDILKEEFINISLRYPNLPINRILQKYKRHKTILRKVINYLEGG